MKTLDVAQVVIFGAQDVLDAAFARETGRHGGK